MSPLVTQRRATPDIHVNAIRSGFVHMFIHDPNHLYGRPVGGREGRGDAGGLSLEDDGVTDPTTLPSDPDNSELSFCASRNGCHGSNGACGTGGLIDNGVKFTTGVNGRNGFDGDPIDSYGNDLSGYGVLRTEYGNCLGCHKFVFMGFPISLGYIASPKGGCCGNMLTGQ